MAQPASPSVITTAGLPSLARTARAISSASEPASGTSSRAADLAGFSRSADRSTASRLASSPSSERASEGGTSRSTTVGTPASRAISRASRAVASGSCETSVVSRAARRIVAA
jgi:hypothetical protein